MSEPPRPAWSPNSEIPSVKNTPSSGPGCFAIFIVVAVLLVGGLAVFAVWGFGEIGRVSSDFATAADSTAGAFGQSGITLSALESVATPEYLAEIKAQGPTALDKFTVLGDLKSIEKCQLVQFKVVNSDGDGVARCPATFAKGAASLMLQLQLRSGAWKLNGVSIEIG